MFHYHVTLTTENSESLKLKRNTVTKNIIGHRGTVITFLRTIKQSLLLIIFFYSRVYKLFVIVTFKQWPFYQYDYKSVIMY